MTGDNQVAMMALDPTRVDYGTLLKAFWQAHNPTRRMRKSNDVGSQYRSGIYYSSDPQLPHARASLERYQTALAAGGYGPITTEIPSAAVRRSD